MRVLLIHNQHRSAAPSGDNRVVEREGEALARGGQDVMRLGKQRRDYRAPRVTPDSGASER
jgi:hypothetical protein